MIPGPVPPDLVGRAIRIDEIGMEYGVYGRYRLRSAYQPIYERRGPLLVPVACEGLISPHLEGEAVAPRLFFAGIPDRDRVFVEALCRALHLRNHQRFGPVGLDLWFGYDPRTDRDIRGFLQNMRVLAGLLPEAGVDPQRLVCQIVEVDMPDPPELDRVADGMRGQGLRVAAAGFGAGESSLERIGRLRPDIVRMDGPWFRKLCREPTAVRLLASLVAGFRQRGTTVLIGGIELAVQQRYALYCGAELYQGFFLARPSLVGAAFDGSPLVIADLLHRTGNVVPLTQGPGTNR